MRVNSAWFVLWLRRARRALACTGCCLGFALAGSGAAAQAVGASGVLGVSGASGASGATGAHAPSVADETASALADYNAGADRDALAQYAEAAARGGRLAQFNYAMMLLNGRGTAVDVPGALHWLERAAAGGMTQAQYVYGTMYDDGSFVARDPVRAHAWLLKAARQGHVQAQLALANQFLDGRGTRRDNRSAFVWYRRAADAGNATAQYVTASYYERGGDGVARNLNLARVYYAAAAAQGDVAAGYKYQEVSAALKAQVAAARPAPQATEK